MSGNHCSILWKIAVWKYNSQCEILTAKSTLTFKRPYIVYMLQDLDILEDWTTIRKVWLTSNGTQVYFYSLLFKILWFFTSTLKYYYKYTLLCNSLSQAVNTNTDNSELMEYFKRDMSTFCFFLVIMSIIYAKVQKSIYLGCPQIVINNHSVPSS